MDQPHFIIVCSLAFLTVFLLLSALALAMRAITVLFPPRVGEDSAALAAAVVSTVAVISPGARGRPDRGDLMLAVSTGRKIPVMLTPFPDGPQSSFGGAVRRAFIALLT